MNENIMNAYRLSKDQYDFLMNECKKFLLKKEINKYKTEYYFIGTREEIKDMLIKLQYMDFDKFIRTFF
ncbi:hypothetical protein C8R30_101172 [Nitrosomonas nitrosa]|nr:hypothetical protein C8R30_101172 [Nitrosomonas nitrosa]